jgi:hypothetical protein
MTRWTVYRIETKEGVYVGVTPRPLKTRLSELRSRRGLDGKISAVAEFDDKATALRLERELRPNYRMGLNISRGGFKCGGNLPKYGSANGMAKRVRVEGIEYPTMQAAADAHGMKKTAVHYRLSSPYFTDWEYVTPPHARYWRDDFTAKKFRRPGISAALQAMGGCHH